MLCDIMYYFVIVGGVVNVYCFVGIEFFDYCCGIIGVMVYVMVVLNLVGMIVVLVIMCDDVKVFVYKE